MTRTTLVTIAVTGPHPVVDRFANGHDDRYWWEVDGPGGMHDGHEATEAQAWAAARAAAVTVLGRLEVPGGGGQLAAALQGPGVCP